MAEVTTEGSEKLVIALREITTTSREITTTSKEMEMRKLDLQVELHAANLEYKRERDRTAVENARLSLFHQSAVVQAISSLAEALGQINQPRSLETFGRTAPAA
jgi:hypothetical protein